MVDDEMKAKMAALIQAARAAKQQQQDDVQEQQRLRDDELQKNINRARALQAQIHDRFTELVAVSDNTLTFQADNPSERGHVEYRVKWIGPTIINPESDRELVVRLNPDVGTLEMGWSINGVDDHHDRAIPASTFAIERIDTAILLLMDNGAWKHSHPKL
jgi:hypothetical protein